MLESKMLELIEMEIRVLKTEGLNRLPVSRAVIFLDEKSSCPSPTGNLTIRDSDNIMTSNANVASAVEKQSQEKKIRLGNRIEIRLPEGNKFEKYQWLKNKVLNCPECNKHLRSDSKLVFGIGNLDSEIFFCGEAPGADEEKFGEPFVGRAGQLLTKIISAMGLSRSDVYISNIMNWRPEMPTSAGNRPPTPLEMEFCLPYLLAQIQIVQPKVIIALGATAASGLLGHGSFKSMKDVRGQWKSFANIPLMVTFHPSYLLRNGTNAMKRIVWEDMLEVMRKVQLSISDKQRNYFL